MAGTPKGSGLKGSGTKEYFAALKEVFALESKVITGVLPHHGERGANDEERIRGFLERMLPRQYSVGTGFVVCNDPMMEASSQTDIIIYDDFHNQQWHRQLVSDVYPIEAVYATIEVKSNLSRGDLGKIDKDIGKVRELSKFRRYVQYVNAPKSDSEPQKRVVRRAEVGTGAPAPRAFVFAYSARGWKTAEALRNSLQRASVTSHIHGLLVLDKDWFFRQEAFSAEGPRFHATQKDGLLNFVAGVVEGVSSMGRLGQMSIRRYIDGPGEVPQEFRIAAKRADSERKEVAGALRKVWGRSLAFPPAPKEGLRVPLNELHFEGLRAVERAMVIEAVRRNPFIAQRDLLRLLLKLR